MHKLERQRDHFNNIAQEYFRTRRGEKQKRLHDLLYKELFRGGVKDYIQGKKKITVLEPMCGFGEGKYILENLFNVEVEYEGFDYSEEIIKCAKQLNPKINVYVQNVISFKSDKKYDIIILIGGLHHIPDYANQIIKKCVFLLKSGGIFINIEPTYNNYIYKKICEYIYIKNPVFDEKTERRFSLKELNTMYIKNNMKIVRQIYPGLLAYLLWYNPDVFPALNKGNVGIVEKVFHLDKAFMYNFIGKKMSVATFTILKKKTKNSEQEQNYYVPVREKRVY